MGNYNKVVLGMGSNVDREPTAEELRDVPRMTRADMTAIMKSADYKSSRLAQKLVAASLQKGLLDEPRTQIDGTPIEPVQSGDMIEAKRDAVRAMFRDPRYKSDAAYRLEVAQKMQELTSQDGTIPAGTERTPGATMSVGISSSPNHGADLQVRSFNRVAIEPTFTPADAPAKPAPVKEAFSD